MINGAVAHYGTSNPTQRQLHNYAFSRQCWTYTPAAKAGDTASCNNAMYQHGYTGGWWSIAWATAVATYVGDSGGGSTGNELLPTSGHYLKCYYDGNNCIQDWATDPIQLDFAHSAYLPPSCTFIKTDPDPTSFTQCAGSGPYRVDIAFPAGSAAEVCPANTAASSRIDVAPTPGTVYLVAPPPSPPAPPAAPPPPSTPPPAPPPPYYSVEPVINSPVMSIAACRQRLLIGRFEQDVETAAECADALALLGIESGHDTEMANSTGLYADGYRCYANGANVFVWSAIVNPMPSRSYVCREGGTPVSATNDDGNRRRMAEWTSRRAYPPPPAPVATLSAWVDASGYFYSATLHAQNRTFASFYPSAEVRGHWEFTKTDVAYVFHPVCGMLCMVDDRVGHKTFYHGYNECRAVSAAMEFFLDDDRC